MKRPVPVLLVEDDDVDVELVRRLFERAKLDNPLQAVSDGREALAALRAPEAADRRYIILLDINMPRMDGFQVLEALTNCVAITPSLIVMCSTSNYEKDIERARALGASGYVEKPPQFSKLRPLLEGVSSLRLNDDADGTTLLRAA
jgi:CheY-like chemotaxis protein